MLFINIFHDHFWVFHQFCHTGHQIGETWSQNLYGNHVNSAPTKSIAFGYVMYITNTVAADHLATQVPRASAAMVLI